MSEECLIESSTNFALEQFVMNMNHATLTKSTQGLMSALGSVNTNFDLIRVGQQRVVQPGVDITLILLGEFGCPSTVTLAIVIGIVAFKKLLSSRHTSALAIERVEASKTVPGLIPQEDQSRMDGQTLLHDFGHVVHVAIEGTVGQQQHLNILQATKRLEAQQTLLDGPKRNTTIHCIRLERKCIQVHSRKTGQTGRVMMRLVCVAIDQNNITRAADGLSNNLVRSRSTVCHPKSVIGAKRLGCELLTNFDRAMRFQQRVQTTAGA
mmetsp:Transcript_44358/g.111765  ORF Transcript_44358/g.111765 Transcript_44358/m.111765 type:complete len:266 (+) Transcript_44358:1163-1960(+)